MLNCWEFMECGYGPYSVEVVCPVAKAFQFQGVNGGDNGGRICWAVPHTSQKPTPDMTKIKECKCECCAFYQQVKCEQGAAFILQPDPVGEAS